MGKVGVVFSKPKDGYRTIFNFVITGCKKKRVLEREGHCGDCGGEKSVLLPLFLFGHYFIAVILYPPSPSQAPCHECGEATSVRKFFFSCYFFFYILLFETQEFLGKR